MTCLNRVDERGGMREREREEKREKEEGEKTEREQGELWVSNVSEKFSKNSRSLINAHDMIGR